jgi:hydroxymethylglutaryl-CoA synthase
MIKDKQFTKVGIVGFGGYVPRYRIGAEEIAGARGKDGKKIAAALGVKQKAVADNDEDAVTMAAEAGKRALERAGIKAQRIGAVLMGSESHPYAVKPSGTIVADILGIDEEYYCVDLEFACKAGTSGMLMIAAMIEAGMIDCGLAIGADAAQAKPGDVLEYTAGAGAAAVILGNKNYSWYAQLETGGSLNTDTADFWRRSGENYPQHAGRFTGEPGYFYHVIEATKRFLKQSKKKAASFDHIILHMPNGKFPARAALRLGVTKEQLEAGFLVREIGNPYSASAMLGLVNVLEQARAGEWVLMTSYGSGAGSDVMSFKIIKGERAVKERATIKSQLKDVEEIDCSAYLLMREAEA